MKKLILLSLLLLSTNVFADNAPGTDRNVEYILNRVYDSSTNTLKSSMASGSSTTRTDTPDSPGSTATTTFDASIAAYRGNYYRDLGASEVIAGLEGTFKNTGSNGPGSGHGMGGMFMATDTSAGKLSLYGLEGKVFGRGTAAGLQYCGILGQPIYIGGAGSRNILSYNIGVLGSPKNYSDETQSTPVDASGFNVAFLADDIIGGSTPLNFSFLSGDIGAAMQNSGDINCKRSDTAGFMRSYGPAGTKNIYISHDDSNGTLAVTTGNFVFAGDGAGHAFMSGFLDWSPLTDATYDLGIASFGWRDLYLTRHIAEYNNVTTAGLGVPAIYSAPAQSATKTANFTVLTYTPPAAAGTYRVNGAITTTSSTNTGTVQFTLDYVDSQGTTHTADVIPVVNAAGSVGTTGTAASKEFHSIPWVITINNSATAIVLKVVVTGSVSYTVTGSVEQIN